MGLHGHMNLPLLLVCGNVLEMEPLFITIEKFTKNEKLADGEISLYVLLFFNKYDVVILF